MAEDAAAGELQAAEGQSAAAGLRFAMVTTFYPPYHFGGDGQAVQRLTHALARRGHEVEVIHDLDAFHTLSREARAPGPEPPGVTVHRLRSRLGPLAALATHQTGRPLVHGRTIRRILERPFDVIHFHNVSLVGGPGVLAYGTAIKLYSAHEHWLVCPTNILWRHQREICDRRECLRCAFHYRRPPQLWRSGSLLRRKSRHVDAFLTYSRFAAGKHAEFGFERPMMVIPPFLPDAEAGAEPVSEAPADRPYVLFVGRLEAIKGLQDVVPLFRGEGPIELRIAGSGAFEARLRELAGGSPRVRFLGQQGPEQLRRLYRSAVAVVVPSVCYEVFPMVVLEAFREGTPVVARRLGPFPEIVELSEGGLLFDSPGELQAALAQIASDPALRGRLGEAARRAFVSHWSEAPAIERYFRLIGDLARRRHRADHLLDRLEHLDAGAASPP